VYLTGSAHALSFLTTSIYGIPRKPGDFPQLVSVTLLEVKDNLLCGGILAASSYKVSDIRLPVRHLAGQKEMALCM